MNSIFGSGDKPSWNKDKVKKPRSTNSRGKKPKRRGAGRQAQKASPDPFKKALKRVRRVFNPKGRIKVVGACALGGTLYVHVIAGGLSAWIPYAAFMSNDARMLLATRGIILLPRRWKKLAALVDDIDFKPMPLVEEPGWTEGAYALVNGRVFSGQKGDKPIVLFAKQNEKVGVGGTLDEWLENVAEPLIDQPLPTFALMVAFAAPLMQVVSHPYNIGFEFAGPKAVGKSTIQFLAASVMGPANSATGLNYWRTANATVAALEEIMAEHNGMVLIIEETNLFAAGESEKTRSDKFNHLVFALAAGVRKARYRATSQIRSYFTYLTSTNEPLETILAGQRKLVTAAAADRLLTLPISPSIRPHGIFDCVPEGYRTAGEFAEALTRAIGTYHGRPIRRFLEKLVKEHRKDASSLRQKIDGYVADFRKLVNVDSNNGSETRVANAFGLMYAAGRLAKAYGALPKAIKVRNAAEVAYALNRSITETDTPMEKLFKHSKRTDLIRIRPGRLSKLTETQCNRAPGFIWISPRGERELLITPKAFKAYFTLAKSILSNEEVRTRMVRDDHLTTKRRLSAKGKKVRVYVFRLLGEDED